MPRAVGVAHYAPLGAAGIDAPLGLFCKPHVQRGVMICGGILQGVFLHPLYNSGTR